MTPPTLTAEQLAELERLHERASRGPWSVVGNTLYLDPPTPKRKAVEGVDWFAFPGNADTALLIAATRNLLPALLAAARERDRLVRDLADAAGELMVPIGAPGTDAAKMLLANVLMRRERDRLREALERIERVESCCSRMRFDVPEDSIKARIPYCPDHGRTKREAAFVAHEALSSIKAGGS